MGCTGRYREIRVMFTEVIGNTGMFKGSMWKHEDVREDTEKYGDVEGNIRKYSFIIESNKFHTPEVSESEVSA